MGDAEVLVKDAEELWMTCASSLQSQVSEATWKTWFEVITPIGVDDGRMRLSVPSSLVKERLESRYRGLVEDVVADAVGFHDVVIDVRTDVADTSQITIDPVADLPAPTVPAAPIADSATAAAESFAATEPALNSRYTFDDFVIGASNRFAHAAALSVAETPAKSYNPLFIHGDAGLGKTHLLHAIGNYVIENFPNRRVRYVSTETFMNEFVDAIRTNTTTAFKRRYRECDVLLIDDIQFMENKEGLQEEFFHTFNSLYGASKQIVISSDRHAKALTTLEDRLRSRFLSGLITDIQPPELETRLAILYKKAEGEGQAGVVPDDVLEFIGTNVKDNIRELEGAFIRVSAFASLSGLPVTRELAEQVLSDIVSNSSPRQITPKTILNETSAMFGFPIDELCGPSRRRPLVTARQISMYVFRELTDASYPAIAREFGGRDHTTVIHAVEKITTLMRERRQIYDQVTELIQRIKAHG